MPLRKFLKTPAERKRYSVDYSDWLDSGELLSALAFTVVPAGSLTISGPTYGSPSTSAAFFALGGVNGNTYEVILTATTSGGQIKQDSVLYTVRDL